MVNGVDRSKSVTLATLLFGFCRSQNGLNRSTVESVYTNKVVIFIANVWAAARKRLSLSAAYRLISRLPETLAGE